MKAIKNNINTIVLALAAVFMLSFTTATPVNKELSENSVSELKFAGRVENSPLFRLVLNNPSSTHFLITVREGNGDLLFSEKLSGSAISRVYKLDTDNSELISGTTFEVTNKTTNRTTVYTIKNLTTTVENLTIAKL